jgi:hypothetical protein
MPRTRKTPPAFDEWRQFLHRLSGRGYHLKKDGKQSVVNPVTGVREGGSFSQRWANKSRNQAVKKGYQPDQYRGYQPNDVSAAQTARRQKLGQNATTIPETFTQDFSDFRFSKRPQLQQGVEKQVAKKQAAAAQLSVQASDAMQRLQQGVKKQVAKQAAAQASDAMQQLLQQGVEKQVAKKQAAAAQLSVQASDAMQRLQQGVEKQVAKKQAQQAQASGISDPMECCNSKYNPSFKGRASYPCSGPSCPPGTIGSVKPDGSVFMVIVTKDGITRWQKYGSMETALQKKRTLGL